MTVGSRTESSGVLRNWRAHKSRSQVDRKKGASKVAGHDAQLADDGGNDEEGNDTPRESGVQSD